MKAALNNQTEYNISLLELIFSVRNKEYGAYVLRISYNKNLTIALFITVFTFIILLISPSFFKSKYDVNLNYKHHTTAVDILPTPDIEKDKKNNTLIEQAVKVDVGKIKFVAPKVVDDALAPDESAFPTIDEMKGRVISTETVKGIDGENILPEEDIIKTDPVSEANKEEAKVFYYVEEMPSYPGGTDELLSLISKNIKYPEIARRAGVEGKVLLGFVVEQDGSLTGINVIKGIGAGCDEEAVRVLKLVGNWLPGKQNGKAVRVSMVIPFVFKLNG
jgi:periplasmic protein TonB